MIKFYDIHFHSIILKAWHKSVKSIYFVLNTTLYPIYYIFKIMDQYLIFWKSIFVIVLHQNHQFKWILWHDIKWNHQDTMQQFVVISLLWQKQDGSINFRYSSWHKHRYMRIIMIISSNNLWFEIFYTDSFFDIWHLTSVM